jgi:hypothetical protein
MIPCYIDTLVYSNINKLNWLTLPLLIIFIPCTVLRYRLAGFLTACSLPLIGIIHRFSLIKRKKLQNDLKALPIVVNPNKSDCREDTRKDTLGNYLDRKKLNLEQISADYVGSYHKFNLEFRMLDVYYLQSMAVVMKRMNMSIFLFLLI